MEYIMLALGLKYRDEKGSGRRRLDARRRDSCARRVLVGDKRDFLTHTSTLLSTYY